MNGSSISLLNYNHYSAGGHLARDKTYEKIAERFYWKALWNDVEHYIRTCEACQRTNDVKFVKEAVPLHPIPVKSKVWNQASPICCVCVCMCKREKEMAK